MTLRPRAHTPGVSGDWHDLVDHLEAVGNRAAEFSEPWGGQTIARVLGLAHDLGKADPAFQRYLAASHNGEHAPRCPHSAVGAAAVIETLGTFVLPILGHHKGMPDLVKASDDLDRAAPDTILHASALWEGLRIGIDRSKDLPNWCNSALTNEFFIRMSFSALVDADYLDTEAHMRGVNRGEVPHPSIEEYAMKLRLHMQAFKPCDSMVARVRQQVLQACRERAEEAPGLFRLTVPTGGGKTLSGLAFALDHAQKNQLRRVVFAIPYTSIIDQTSRVYKDIFGSAAVLEHHSAVDEAEQEDVLDDARQRRKWATENWDSPLIVTTTVQLFESIFANRPGKCRKLHNLAKSVIVLDEVQSLPADKLGPILSALDELVSHYGCTVVLCTATQPRFEEIEAELIARAVEIVPQYQKQFSALKRVRFELINETWTTTRVAKELQSQSQALVVLNSRRSALAIAKACSEPSSVLHLSTLLCGHHRKRVIQEADQRLKGEAPVHLVSTQVVEAGVDLDFPFAMRAMGPLDRIIQTAGRCNREGKQKDAVCKIFKLEGEKTPMGAYATAISATAYALKISGGVLDSEAAATAYWRQLFSDTETGSLHSPSDRAMIQKSRMDLAFESVAASFKMIEEETTAVIVNSYPHADVASLLSAWHESSGRSWMRKIQPYTVNLRQGDVSRLKSKDWLEDHDSGLLIYIGPYDEVLGLDPESDDTTDLNQ